MKISQFRRKNQAPAEIRFRPDDVERAEMVFNPKTGIVDFYLFGNWIYDIDLNRFWDPVEALDWTRQLSQKNWFSLQMMSNLCTLAIGFLNA